jgi:hypothetical protein
VFFGHATPIVSTTKATPPVNGKVPPPGKALPLAGVGVAQPDDAVPLIKSRRDLLTWVTSGLYHVQAALLVTAFLVPIVATIITVAAYLQPFPFTLPWTHPVVDALINLTIAWGLLAVPASLCRLASASHVNSRSVSEISSRLMHITAWLDVVKTRPAPPAAADAADDPWNAETILQTIQLHVSNMHEALQSRGVQWLFGDGYLSLWSELNYVDSLVVYLDARERVWSRAKKALWRMTSSNTLGTQEMIDDLRHAMTLLIDQIDTRPAPATRRFGLPFGDSTARQPDSSAKQYVGWCERTARACVGLIGYLLNEKRTDTYSGFVRSRNILVGTCGLTSLVLYLLFWLAILSDPINRQGQQIVTSAIFFYFIGAAVGLFNLLYVQSGLESMIDDYHLATVRVMVAPQLSGLAAVLGVIVTSLATNYGTQPLENVLNVTGRPVNVLAAAGFALSPGLVLARFRRHTEEAKRDLKSSKGADRESA